jgi:hypothetical protein
VGDRIPRVADANGVLQDVAGLTLERMLQRRFPVHFKEVVIDVSGIRTNLINDSGAKESFILREGSLLVPRVVPFPFKVSPSPARFGVARDNRYKKLGPLDCCKRLRVPIITAGSSGRLQ